jgi:hypothetical protein
MAEGSGWHDEVWGLKGGGVFADRVIDSGWVGG